MTRTLRTRLKIVLIFMAVVFCFAIGSSASVYAEETELVDEGMYDGVPWKIERVIFNEYYSENYLIIGEEGKCYKYQYRETREAEDYPWHKYRQDCLDKVIVAGEVSGNGSAAYMFYNIGPFTRFDVAGFRTEDVTDMKCLFCGSMSWVSSSGNPVLDVSHFNTAKVKNMAGMFFGCNAEDLDVSGFDTSQVTDMSEMFYGCSEVKQLDVSGFDTSQVTSMSEMFRSCSELQEIDVSHFNTAKVTDMRCMFDYCREVKKLDVSNFDTHLVKDMAYMFCDCAKLTEIKGISFDVSATEDMLQMFSGCRSLKSLDLSSFDLKHKPYTRGMFTDCISLTSLKVGKWASEYDGYGGDADVAHFPRTMYDIDDNFKEYSQGDVVPACEYHTFVADADEYIPKGDFKYYATKKAYLKQNGFLKNKKSRDVRQMLQENMSEEKSRAIPGIIQTVLANGSTTHSSKNYIPQGLCNYGKYYIATAYEKPKTLGRSVLYVMDGYWKLKKTITIGDYKFHNGGIACDNTKNKEVIWLCGNTEKKEDRIAAGDNDPERQWVYALRGRDLDNAIDAEKSVVHIDSFEVGAAQNILRTNKASCLDYYDGRLWVGTCIDKKSNQPGCIVGYKTSGMKLDMNNTIRLKTEKCLNGFTFSDNGELYLSYSEGRQATHAAKIVKCILPENMKQGECYDMTTAERYSVNVPKMNEEIMLYDDDLYVLYESAADIYADRNSQAYIDTKQNKEAHIKTDRFTALPVSLWSDSSLYAKKYSATKSTSKGSHLKGSSDEAI